MFKLRKLNTHGVAHHAVLMLLVVMTVAGVGAYEVTASHADALNTADYSVKASSENGCWLTGRNYVNGSCQSTCRSDNTTYDYNGTNPGYCTGHIAANETADDCVQNQHRMYVIDVGCARRAGQDANNNSRQCTGWSGYSNATHYSNYVSDYTGSTDKCIAPTIAPTPTLPQPGKPTSNPDTNIAKDYCQLLGRNYIGSTCQESCSNASATLLVSNSVDYCSGYIASMSPANCSATFRNYVTVNGNNVGCARRPNQDSATDTARCQANEGYKYYVGIPGGTDYCTPSAGNIICTGPIKALNTTAAGKVLCPGGSTSSGGISGGNDPITGLPLPTFPTNGTVTSSAPQSGQGKAVKVEAMSQKTCHLLGREWEKATKDKDGTKQAAGCSEDSCYKNDKIDVHKSNGSYFCDGYATTLLTQDKCSQLHRKWADAVKACASLPNQNDKPGTRHIKAEACAGAYTTYIYRTAQYDECLKPGTVDNLKNVARVSGLPFVKVTTLSKAGLCNALPHKHWNGSRCIQDRPASTGGGNNSTSTSSSPSSSTFCASLHRTGSGTSCGGCVSGYPYLWNNPDPSAFNVCYPSKAASPDGTGHKPTDTSPTTYCNNPDHASQCTGHEGGNYCDSTDHAAQCQTGNTPQYRTVNETSCTKFLSDTHSGNKYECTKRFIIKYCPGNSSAVSATVTIDYTHYHIDQICEK